MKKILISLISRQPMPNYIGAKIVNPDKMVYFYTAQEETTMENLCGVLNIPDDPYKVEAFNFFSIQEALEQVDELYGSNQITLNVTGGTKIMALPAFNFAREKNWDIIYINTAENQLLRFEKSSIQTHPLPEVIDIKTYLELHGHTLLENKSPKFSDISEQIADNYDLLRNFLQQFRRFSKQKWERKSFQLTEDEKAFLGKLTQTKFLQFNAQTNELERPEIKIFEFLAGKWLEEYVYAKIQKQSPHKTQMAVKISWQYHNKKHKNDFDVMVIKNNKLYIFECKSGSEKEKDIHRLEALREIVGGTYGRAYYVAAEPVSRETKERIRDFKEVELLKMNDFIRGANILL